MMSNIAMKQENQSQPKPKRPGPQPFSDSLSAKWRSKGWNGIECLICFVRRIKLKSKTWDISARFCPSCAEDWLKDS